MTAPDHAARQLHRPLTAADLEAAYAAGREQGFAECRGLAATIAESHANSSSHYATRLIAVGIRQLQVPR